MTEQNQNPLESMKMKLDQLHHDFQLPYWKVRYGESMLKKAKDFWMVGQENHAQKILEKVEIWISKQRPSVEKQVQANRKDERDFQKVLALRIENVLLALETLLKKYYRLIPRMERSVFETRLDQISAALQKLHGNAEAISEEDLDLGQIREELNSLRNRMISRIRRSLRAQKPSVIQKVQQQELALSSKETGDPEGLAMVGPYNTRANMSEALNSIGERDPIWVEDLMQCYHHLLQFQAKVVGDKIKFK